MEKIMFVVEDATNLKIRDYLTKRLGFSTSLIAKVKYDNVFLNGTPVHMRALVNSGDKIEILMPELDSDIEPIDIKLKIIYEDDYILVVDKPKNMPIHPSRGNSLPTLANAVRAYIGKPFVFRSLTRLDRDTSGLVLIAKDQLSCAILSRDIKSGRIQKSYVAIVVGTPNAFGVIDAPIERESEGSIKRIVREDGKRAVTEYHLLSSNGDRSLIKVNLITGRTHQIRVHMAHIGHPLYADFLYGERVDGETYTLRCVELEFTHPITKEQMIITSDYMEVI